ncbi:biopolymer transporter ExbD [Limibacter armeniacum]|uniref:ExbD/TolR family protein n=1 Tax=Limibacter armeniacum TaxID=466084 RepID=UPI002FE693AB
MGLKPENKIDPTFNMSSMTDMIFLLLVFFMLTSNFVTPAGLPISVPTNKKTKTEKPKETVKVTVSLRRGDKYYVNKKAVPFEYVEDELSGLLPEKDGLIILTVAEGVPVQNLVNIASLASKLKAKVSITPSK